LERIADKNKTRWRRYYQFISNNGYSTNINAVEQNSQRLIDFGIELLKVQPAYFNKITVTGNDKQKMTTRKPYRELRTNQEKIHKELQERSGKLTPGT
jgi:outer membrane protein insertion porin family